MTNRKISNFCGAILDPQGYEVILAPNGTEALARIADSHINLVLLDVMMPNLNGYDVCARIRENEQYSSLPVVIITALSSKKDRIRGIEAGADDFLSKPFNREEVLVRVRTLLKMRELDEELKSSYNRIAAVSELGSQLIKDFTPAVFDMDMWMDRIVAGYFDGFTDNPSAPEAILTGIRTSGETWLWRLRTLKNGTLDSRPVSMSICPANEEWAAVFYRKKLRRRSSISFYCTESFAIRNTNQ